MKRHFHSCRLLFTTIVLISFSASAQNHNLKNGIFYATVNGVKHWYKIGGAEHHTLPIVVIHGGPGGNQYVFERTAGRELEKNNTVIYYEQRGSGRSNEPNNDTAYSMNTLVSDLEGLREYWGLPQFIPLGYSFGATLSMEYALMHPGRVKGLILQSFASLQDSAVLLEQLAHFYSIADKELRPGMDSLFRLRLPLSQTYNAVLSIASRENVIHLLTHDPRKGEQMFAMWEESKLKNTGKMMAVIMKEERKNDLAEDARSLKMQVLLLMGLYDRNGAVISSLKLKDKLSHVKLVVFENSGHFPDLEEPDKYSTTVSEWLSNSVFGLNNGNGNGSNRRNETQGR